MGFLFKFFFVFHSGLGRGRSLLNFPTDEKVSAFCFFPLQIRGGAPYYRVGTRDRMQMISRRLTKCVDSFDFPPQQRYNPTRQKIPEFLVATGFILDLIL